MGGKLKEKPKKTKNRINRFFVQIPVFYFRQKNRFKPVRFKPEPNTSSELNYKKDKLLKLSKLKSKSGKE